MENVALLLFTRCLGKPEKPKISLEQAELLALVTCVVETIPTRILERYPDHN